MTMEALPQDLADFLVTKNFDPEYFDKQGQPSEAGKATTIKFDYVADSGKNYGTAVCVISNDELSLYYGDNLGRGMEPEDKDDWYSFLEQLSNQASSHSAMWSPTEINKLKHNLAGIAAIKEGLFEGYYGNRRVSYMGEQTQARLVINHNRVLGENDKRFRYVESLFIETADQERFRLPFKSLGGGRAMLEHVRQGGRPYDVRGNHITEVVSEMAVLSRFNRAQHSRVFEGVTQELVESAQQYYRNLQETVKHLGSPRGYQAYFESWAPDQTGEAEALVENLRDLFVEQTLDARIEAALPTLAKIQQQGNNMKEAQIFENWINNLSEGTWALPETPEQMEKLNQLMSGELIVGPDATNATEQLYDLVGDDELFDILNDLADKSEGRANCWDDSDVQRRLAELGIQTPQSTQAEPAAVPQDTAPPVAEGGAKDRQWSNKDMERLRVATRDFDDIMASDGPEATKQNLIKKRIQTKPMAGPKGVLPEQGMAESDFEGPYDGPIKFQPGDSQAYRDAYAQGRSISIQNRADAAEKTLAQRAAEPRTFGQKITRDIGDPLKQLAKGNVKGALFDPPASLTNKGGGSAGRGGGGGGFMGPGGMASGGRRPGDLDNRFNPLKLENAELATMLKYAGIPLNEDANVRRFSFGKRELDEIEAAPSINQTNANIRGKIAPPAQAAVAAPSINQTNANILGKIAPPTQAAVAAPTAASIIGNSPQVKASQTTPVANPGKPEAGVAFNQAKPPPAPTAASIIGNSPQVQASKSLPTTTAAAAAPVAAPAAAAPKYAASVAFNQDKPPIPAAAPVAAAPDYKADVAFGKGSPGPAPTTATATAAPTTTPAAPDYKADVAFGKGSPAATTATATTPNYKADVAFNQNKPAVAEETDAEETDKDFAYILKHAGVPIKEGVLTDSTGSTMEHIKDTYKRDIKDFAQTGKMSKHLFQALYDYYYDDMPYGARSSDGDPYEWISDRFADDLGINENLISPMIMPVSEGSCNMTTEGSYCPEHGLAECGSMYEDGGDSQITPGMKTKYGTVVSVDGNTVTVRASNGELTTMNIHDIQQAMYEDGGAVGMPYSMGKASMGLEPIERDPDWNTYDSEISGSTTVTNKDGKDSYVKKTTSTDTNPAGKKRYTTTTDVDGVQTLDRRYADEGNDDPINSNSAMTGSYYEGKETRTQEGDALLARIKSLALLR